jgi:hypothetical protein
MTFRHDPFPALPIPTTVNPEDISNLGNVTIRGDIRSYAWDGGGSLAAGEDTAASAGFLLDSSAGSAQFEGSLFLGGALSVTGSVTVSGTLTLSGALVAAGDIYSDNWDGAIPANLAAVDATATVGFYFDGSVGAAQVQRLFVGDVDGHLIIHAEGDYPNLSFYSEALTQPGIIRIGDAAGVGRLELHPPYETGTNGVLQLLRSSGGSQMLYSGSEFIAALGVVKMASGSASAPAYSFNDDPDTGIYRVGTNILGVSAGGAAAATFEAGGQFRTVDGTVSAPSLSFIQDPDTGFFRGATNQVNFVAGGVTQFHFNASNAGSPVIGNNTTGSAANMFIESTGSRIMFRSTSALKYKSKITTNVGYLADIDLIPTKHYRKDDGRWRYSLIADWLGDQDPLLGDYGDEGIEDYDVRGVLAVMAAKINRLERELANG